MYRIIFEHFIIKGKEKEFVSSWKKGSDVIQQQLGVLGSRLFRSLENPEVFYAIADWESKKARDIAITNLKKRENFKEILTGHEKFVKERKKLASMELLKESKIKNNNIAL